MKKKNIMLVIALAVGLLIGTVNLGLAASFLLDPNGPTFNGAWYSGAEELTPPWPNVYGNVGPGGSSSRWTIVNWGDKAKWPENYQSDGSGGFIVYHPIAGYFRWYALPGGRYGFEVSRDTVWSGWGLREIDDGVIPTPPLREQPGMPDGVISDLDPNSPTLADLSLFRIRARQNLLQAWQGSREAWNYISTIMAVILWNNTNREVLWYYIITYDSRGLYPDGAWQYVRADLGDVPTRGGGNVYEHLLIDRIQTFGYMPLVPGGGAKTFLCSILPRLKSKIQNAPDGVDRNLANWKVATMYVGSIVEGEGIIVSRHDTFLLDYLR